MNPTSQSSDKIGANRNILNRHERVFRRGSLMFIEGESSAEMYIIHSGKVRILKQEGESTIELAVLGPGSVLGELALLDHQPRSATAQVVEDTSVTVVDEELFAKTLQQIPSWFGNLIQLIVKRLRDTMKKTCDDIVMKNIAGVIRVILLLADDIKDVDGEKMIMLSKVKETVFSIIGIGGLEVENIFLHLILKEMVVIKKNQMGEEFLLLKNHDILILYMNYLRAKQAGTFLVGENFTEEVFELLDTILKAGERGGILENSRLMKVGIPQVELELERIGKEKFINLDSLDKLVDSKLIIKQEDATESDHGIHKRTVIIYNPDTLKKVRLLRLWLPVFKEDVIF